MIKKISTIIFAITFMLVLGVTASAEIIDSGNCGDDVTYTVDDEYNLVISGEGAMWEYENAVDKKIPWYDYRSQIKNVRIEEGITSIGKATFAHCKSMTNVSLPNSIDNISNRAFMYCSSLKDIVIPENVSILASLIFTNCTNLQNIRMSNKVSLIEERAFDNCTSLQNVYFYGTEEEWNSITIATDNENLIKANIVCVPEVLPISITINSKPIYVVGEDDNLDVSVNLNYNDGTSNVLSSNEYTIETDFDASTEGKYSIEVTYGEFSATKQVAVETLKMKSISIQSPPNNINIIEGTQLDFTGLVVVGVYNNGSTEEINNYVIEDYDNHTIGSLPATVTYNGFKAIFIYVVSPKSLIGIEVNSPPYKTNYINDETELDLDGLRVRYIYNNNAWSSCNNYTVTGFNPTKSGKQIITVKSGDFTDTFEINVKHYEYKINSISKDYDFNNKFYTINANILSRTEAQPVKVISAVYTDEGALVGTKIEDVYFDKNASKQIDINIGNIDYPYNNVKIFIWDFDLNKMLPLAINN